MPDLYVRDARIGPPLEVHDPRCVLDPLHHRETPCTWFATTPGPTEDHVRAARLRDWLDNVPGFAELYREAEAEIRGEWRWAPALLWEDP